MLTNFKKEQEKITQAYKKLIEYKFVPLKRRKITEKDIEESIKELQEARFIVSFCGQIKAGKSTLLNALLFGDEILPAASTPHTAKITIIKYAEEPYFEVVYYTEEEWKELKETLKKEKIEEDGVTTTYFDKYLKPQLNNSISHGIYEDDVIGKSKETVKDLSKLDDYVGAKGKYMPFVKEIHLYWPNEILKQITIVDTPGTNDPNPFRSKITEDWIHKSNAVVYVVYAGQAFSTADIEFIDKYLLGIDPDLLVFAVNKMDMVDKSELEVWINKVREDEKLKARRIMQDKDSVVYVSGLGGLIRKLYDAGKLEDSKYGEDEEFIEILDESGYIENPGLEDLERVIEKKIIKSKGKKLLASHKAKIKGIIIDKITEIKEEIRLLSKKLEFYSLKKEELEVEIKKYKAKEQELAIKTKALDDAIKTILAEFQGELQESILNIEGNLLTEIRIKIGELTSFDDIRVNAAHIVSNTLHKYNNLLFSKLIGESHQSSSPINHLTTELSEKLKNFEKEFQGNSIITAGIKSRIYEKLTDEIAKLTESTRDLIRQNAEELSKLGFFKTLGSLIKVVDKNNELENRKKSLISRIEQLAIKPYFQNITESIFNIANEQATQIKNTITAAISNEIAIILDNLREIQKSVENNAIKAKEIHDQIKSLESVLQKYTEFAKEISQLIGVEVDEI